MEKIKNAYQSIGGRFITQPAEMASQLKKIKAIVYDWDGVFNNGSKNSAGGSNFSEVDSMGTNLLRYSFYLINSIMPVSAVISGEQNETAFFFCKRECFHYSFFKIADKALALEQLCKERSIAPNEVAYFFDDVLDLPIAKSCGIRILVNQRSNPLFAEYCERNHMVDYITSSRGGEHAVREGTELLIALNGNYDQVISDRTDHVDRYKNYILERRKIQPEFFTLSNSVIEKVSA